MLKLIIIALSYILSVITTVSIMQPSIWMSIVMVLLTAAYVLAFVLLFFIVAIIVGLPISSKKEYKTKSVFYDKFYLFCNQLVINLFDVKMHAEGTEILPESNMVLICNHRSNVDSFCMDKYLKKYYLVYMAKRSLFKIPFFGKIIHRVGFLKAERDNPRSDAKMIAKGINMLKNDNISVGVFPEGTRNLKDTNVAEFKHGVFHLALKSKKPIVVACMNGTQNVKHNLLTQRHDVYLKFIKVLYYDDYKDMSINEVSDYCRNLIIEGLKTL